MKSKTKTPDEAPRIEMLPIAEVRPRERNPRKHPPEQIEALAKSIREFGFTAPVLIEADGTLIAGHGRVEAAKKAGLERVPCLRVGHLTPAQVRAYVIADNRLGLDATWPEWCASMRQAGVLIGQTWSRMKWAKAHGSPGFHASGRVNPRLVASWLDVQEATKPPQPVPIAIEVKERSLEEELRDLNMLLAQFDRAATVAMSANDLERSASVNEQTKTAATRREQIWKQMGRLGRNDEEALNKSEVVRIIRALAIQSIHGLQRTAREAAGKLQGITDPAEVFRVLTSEMTAEAFARPFEEATKLEAAHGLPSWVADEMIGSVARMTE